MDESLEYITSRGIEKAAMVERFNKLLMEVWQIIDYLKIANAVRVDQELLGSAVFNYFVDIARLKDTHGIKRVSVKKIYSRGVYWFLKRKPIQLTYKVPSHLVNINEKVALFLLVPKILEEMSLLQEKEKHNDASKCFLDLLYHSFKYRTYTRGSLELMNEAFFCGASLCKDLAPQ